MVSCKGVWRDGHAKDEFRNDVQQNGMCRPAICIVLIRLGSMHSEIRMHGLRSDVYLIELSQEDFRTLS